MPVSARLSLDPSSVSLTDRSVFSLGVLAFPLKLPYLDTYKRRAIPNLQFTIRNFLAGVAELVDAQDLKSCVLQRACGFESRPRHID
ncbi:MAG: hypothetical protein HW389_3065 [Bacteroidetes bacterium]|nr:hypothetical protein [Bacteroidota bacterium]